jgi:hypothetical protein
MNFVLPRSDEPLICSDDEAAQQAIQLFNCDDMFNAKPGPLDNHRHTLFQTDTHWCMISEDFGRPDGDNGFFMIMLPKAHFTKEVFVQWINEALNYKVPLTHMRYQEFPLRDFSAN